MTKEQREELEKGCREGKTHSFRQRCQWKLRPRAAREVFDQEINGRRIG